MIDKIYLQQLEKIENLFIDKKINSIGKLYMIIVASGDLYTRLEGKQVTYQTAKEHALKHYFIKV